MPSRLSSVRDFLERLRHLPDTPLSALRRSVWWVRKTFFTRPRPGDAGFVVPLSEAEVTRVLGERYFEPGWEFSYSYSHETLNLRRVEYFDHPEYDYRWWQVHVRGYDHPRGLELTAHFETEPTESPDAHTGRVGLELERGMDALREVLEDAGVEYETPGE